MTITAKAWNEYKSKMSQISRKAADLMQEWIDKNGIEDRKALVSYGNALVMRYGNAAGTLACNMYEKTAVAQGKTVPAAEVAELPTFKEVAKVINGTLKQSKAKVPATVGRLTKQVGADTTLKNAQRDGAQFAWIPGGGETCAFCIALAARGWQYMSKNSMRGGHAEHIHAGCNCQYSIRFDNSSNIEGYDADEYYKLYKNAEGKNQRDKIKTLSRELRKKLKMKSNVVVNKETSDKIKVNKVIDGHSGSPKTSKPNSIIDHLGKNNKTETRTFYDNAGYKKKDISNHDHGYPKTHPYGNKGEHAHDYEWDKKGRLKNRTIRELTNAEREENKDIL